MNEGAATNKSRALFCLCYSLEALPHPQRCYTSPGLPWRWVARGIKKYNVYHGVGFYTVCKGLGVLGEFL